AGCGTMRTSSSGAVGSTIAVDIFQPSLGSDARIEPAVKKIGDEECCYHRDGDDKEDSLEHWVIALINAFVQAHADSLVLEDRLHQQRTTNHETNGDGELGEQRQDRVTADVEGKDAPFRHTAGATS